MIYSEIRLIAKKYSKIEKVIDQLLLVALFIPKFAFSLSAVRKKDESKRLRKFVLFMGFAYHETGPYSYQIELN
ncbi:MAG: hypothetical protein WCR72_05780 [Bacteroidota bacterium]